MIETLLPTKLYIPPQRPNFIPRPRLVEQLFKVFKTPGSFTLMSSPAGSGKTVLLSEFASVLKKSIAWVSLDESDNDPIRFWRYLIAACQTVDKEVGGSIHELLQSPQPLSAESIATILIKDLAEITTEFVLVLDDYHVIENESIHQACLYLLEYLPVQVHLVISTRIDPQWPLARFRASNKLIEIRMQDMRFTTDEAASFLNQLMGLDLTPQDIAVIENRTEGWIAGLQLAALSMQGRRDPAKFIQDFAGSHVYIAEYLIEEVLNRQPQTIQTFLLKTSILDNLTAELCEAVAECRNGQEILAGLNRSNIFVIPLDDEGRWFRYHHLFKDLLQARLRYSCSTEQVADLHSTCAEWYQQHGFLNEAVDHLLKAKDFDRAAQIIGQTAYHLITSGELATVLKWTEMLPGELVWRYPMIIITRIWALTLAGEVLLVEPLLQQAEDLYTENPEIPERIELASFAAAIRAFFAMMAGKNSAALQLAGRAEKLLPKQSVHARWLLPYTIASAHRAQGDYEKAAEALKEQVQMGEDFENLVVWGTGITGLALVRRTQGRLNEVIRICLDALKKLADRGADRFGSLAKIETPLIEVLLDQNELEEARDRLMDVISRMQAWPMPTDQLHAQLTLIGLQAAEGNLDGAFETLESAKAFKAAHPVLINLARSVDLLEIRLMVKTEEIAGAERMLDGLNPGSIPWKELQDRERLLLARIRMKQGLFKDAEKILSPLIGEAEGGGRRRTLIEGLVLLAGLYSMKGNRDAAQELLMKALALAEPERFVRVFIEEGGELMQLIASINRKLDSLATRNERPSKAYLDKLLKSFPDKINLPMEPNLVIWKDGMVECLTPRELEVLCLISQGDSNREIAEKLYITISAVKKHAANIFGKLNVSNRTQAAAEARQLGLLDLDN